MWKRLRRLLGFKPDGHALLKEAQYRILPYNEQGATGVIVFDRTLTQAECEALQQACDGVQ